MSRKVRFQEIKEIRLNIYTDPHLSCEAKLILLYMLENERYGRIEDKEIMQRLNIDRKRFNKAKKQLEELNLLALEEL